MNFMPVCHWKWVLEKKLFQRITSFRSIFQIYVVWVPISAVEGPHWVPISLEIRSPLGPYEFFLGPHAIWEQCNTKHHPPVQKISIALRFFSI